MIFKPEMVEKILAGEKTVTRRPVKFETVDHGVTVERPCRYVPGEDYAVQPVIEDGPGKGRGGKEVVRIRIKSVRRISLGHQLTIIESAREGFGGFRSFRDYWENLYDGPGSYNPTQPVDRIEFELLTPPARGDLVMAEETKRCYVCRREGTQQFRWVPESEVGLPKRFGGGTAVVGGWHACSNKNACHRRIAKHSVGRAETEYP